MRDDETEEHFPVCESCGNDDARYHVCTDCITAIDPSSDGAA